MRLKKFPRELVEEFAPGGNLCAMGSFFDGGCSPSFAARKDAMDFADIFVQTLGLTIPGNFRLARRWSGRSVSGTAAQAGVELGISNAGGGCPHPPTLVPAHRET
jgi:hypothetical protein